MCAEFFLVMRVLDPMGHFPQYRPQAVQVTLIVPEFNSLILLDFRRNVAFGASNLMVRTVIFLGWGKITQKKVPVFINQDVLRLDIAMNDVLLFKML
jgi:hypothetical protein